MTHVSSTNSNASETEDPSLIVFADDWARHPSSCQHLVERLRSHCRVLWVNTIGTRSPKANAFTVFRGVEKIRSWTRGVQQVSETMWVLDAPMLPYVGNRLARRVNRTLVTSAIQRGMKRAGIQNPVVLTTLPHTSWLLGKVGQQSMVYYCTDDYSHWPEADRESLLSAERDLQSKCDLVLAVSDRLVERNADAKSCKFFPHAVDFDHFASVQNTEATKDLDQFPRPRVGFFGLIYEKLDFQLLTQIAVENPEASLVMIGPVDFCPDEFSKLDNVKLVGQQPYQELPQWLAGLDLLLMPYVHDEMIQQSSPLKLRECLASGLPTICVNLPEAHKSEPHLTVAANSEHFRQLVKQHLQTGRNAEASVAQQDFVRNETWDARAQELRAILRELVRS